MSGITLMGVMMKMIIIALSATETRVESQVIALPDCPDSCGHVKIPYAFGTSEGCFLSKKFWIDCDQSLQQKPKPFLGNRTGNLPLSNISPDGELGIMVYVARDCYDQDGKRVSSESNSPTWLRLTEFNISSTRNKFVAVGCDTYATVKGYRGQKKYITGCISSCSDIDVGSSITNNQSSCSGVGCCQTSIPSGLRNITVYLGSFSNHTSVHGFNPCSYAFVVQDDQFMFSSASFRELNDTEMVPMVLNWGIGEEGCDEAEKRANFTCKANTNCVQATNGPGYLCQCKPGYEGNPYHPDGCQDIDECKNSKHDCNPGKCNNRPGTWECFLCPKGYNNTGKACIENTASDPQRPILLYIALGLGIPLSVAISMICCWGMKKRKLNELKQRFFEQNGGLMLQQRLPSFETAKIFSAEELQKATNNYDENRVIGEGGYGKVYKGILPDGQEVAIKKSKIGDQSLTAQFINEITVLLQINHRNVVKLLGCCLETEVPLLVYQFITNGTLFHHIHNKGRASILPWKLRLKIASETAGALAYLHSATSTPIIHRDVKTTNILLDDNYIAKVSDFGASRFIPLDQYQLTTLVQGTLGYLDPEYFHSSQLTEKSDVYSFGVVLAELLTSKKAVSFERPEGERNLAMFFVTAVLEESRLLDVLDGDIVNEENVEEVKKVANLAKMCLSVKGEERPSMKEVANELEGLINLDKHPWGKGHLYQEETEYLLGSPSNTYESSGGRSGLEGVAITTGFDSMQIQMLRPYNDAQ